MNSHRKYDISTSFRIPKRMQGEKWIFSSHTVALQIKVKNARTVEFQSLRSVPEHSKEDHMTSLDWMAITMETIRYLCRKPLD